MNIEALREELLERGFEPDNSIIFASPSYESAIIGISTEGNVVYSFNKMVEDLMSSDKIDMTDAVEIISHNTIRSLDYLNEGNEKKKPIIIFEMP